MGFLELRFFFVSYCQNKNGCVTFWKKMKTNLCVLIEILATEAKFSQWQIEMWLNTTSFEKSMYILHLTDKVQKVHCGNFPNFHFQQYFLGYHSHSLTRENHVQSPHNKWWHVMSCSMFGHHMQMQIFLFFHM